jgi:Cytochrome c554 and c-prime
LFWQGDGLFQLPISYWKELGWINSPGYKDGVANFDRAIIPRCLECHATYFESSPLQLNHYRKDTFILGITCEKCHGPASEHARLEGSKPPVASELTILNPSRFSRARQMDLCAWCHAGQGVSIAPPFSYHPGEPLDKYLELPKADPDSDIDVHGSQVELLEKSRCFRLSTMTCLTCHDVHTLQHDLLWFSQRCLSCHKPDTPMFPKLTHEVKSDCIGCHMPLQTTNLIIFAWNGRKSRPQVRSHWIKVHGQAISSK